MCLQPLTLVLLGSLCGQVPPSNAQAQTGLYSAEKLALATSLSSPSAGSLFSQLQPRKPPLLGKPLGSALPAVHSAGRHGQPWPLYAVQLSSPPPLP